LDACRVCKAPVRDARVCDECFQGLVRCDVRGLAYGGVIGIVAGFLTAPLASLGAIGVMVVTSIFAAGVLANAFEADYRRRRARP